MASEEDIAVPLVRVRIPTSRKRREKWGTQDLFHRRYGVFQSGAVAGCIAGAGRAVGSDLPVWQITAEHGKSDVRKGFGKRDQQRRICVRACAVREDEPPAGWGFGEMQPSSNFGIEGVVDKLADGCAEQAYILIRAAPDIEADSSTQLLRV